MKYKIIFLFPIFLVVIWSISGNAADLDVRLANSPASGIVIFELFDSANTFGDLRDPVKVQKFPLDGRGVYHIKNIPPGEYALLVYYDENNNDRIDKNFIGIPREPLGFSNSYRPKGPPSYKRASFILNEEMTLTFDVKLYRPLGKFGRIGVGIGAIMRSSPYRGYDAHVLKVIPAITYNGSRLQILGPNVKVGLIGSGKIRLAVTGRYRIGVYEEDESDFLNGMGDRDDTFMAGLALQNELPGGMDISVSYEHDILDQIGGGAAKLELKKSIQSGLFRFSPKIGLNWLSSELSNHDFGVPTGKATSERPEYTPGATISFEGGLGMFIEIATDWMFIVNSSVEFLDNKVTDSPIVSDNYVIKGFGAITYLF